MVEPEGNDGQERGTQARSENEATPREAVVLIVGTLGDFGHRRSIPSPGERTGRQSNRGRDSRYKMLRETNTMRMRVRLGRRGDVSGAILLRRPLRGSVPDRVVCVCRGGVGDGQGGWAGMAQPLVSELPISLTGPGRVGTSLPRARI